MVAEAFAAAPIPNNNNNSNASNNKRTGILQSLLDLALDSPVWKHVLVPQARKKMVDTAAENGIPWTECKAWIQSQDGPWNSNNNEDDDDFQNADIPDYYRQSFHAYQHGNLCWDAALEVEIASAAVGARNFPALGRRGEDAFRDAFHTALVASGATCPDGGIIVDLGCGTGMSTRRVAGHYPQAAQVIGMDLSPYFCHVGTKLLELAPVASIETGGLWVSAIEPDSRIEYRVGNAARTELPANSVDVVLLQFVAHECPSAVTMDILREAHRILQPDGGQLWFCEMDFETPGYAAQRANPLLFSLQRATEPYLDDYAEHAPDFRNCLADLFASTVVTPATGRHFSIVATKGDHESVVERSDHVFRDDRFDEHGIYRVEDTHLGTLENKL